GEGSPPLLADLGLAKHFDSTTSTAFSRSGVLRGTAGYMPLEQMTDARSVGPPADVCALGCVLYECLTGEPAFRGETPIEVVSRVDEARFARLAVLRADVPPALAAAIESALARDASARPPDGFAFERALRATEKPRRLRALAVLIVSLLLAVAGAAAASGLARRAKPAVIG